MRFCSELILRAAVCVSLTVAGLQAEVISVVRADAHTGRLIRTVIGPKPSLEAGRQPEVRAMIDETAKNLDVSPLLVHSVIQVESNYNTYAVSPKGAQGLMQLMPATARRFGVKNTFDARQNVQGGVRYLKFLKETFQDDQLAIAAYNAGEKAVAKYGNVPPYPETVSYVAKVGKKYGEAKHAAEKNKAASRTVDKMQPVENSPRHIVGYFDPEGRLHIAMR